MDLKRTYIIACHLVVVLVVLVGVVRFHSSLDPLQTSRIKIMGINTYLFVFFSHLDYLLFSLHDCVWI